MISINYTKHFFFKTCISWILYVFTSLYFYFFSFLSFTKRIHSTLSENYTRTRIFAVCTYIKHKMQIETEGEWKRNQILYIPPTHTYTVHMHIHGCLFVYIHTYTHKYFALYISIILSMNVRGFERILNCRSLLLSL